MGVRAIVIVFVVACGGGGSAPGGDDDGGSGPDAGPEATECPATVPEVVAGVSVGAKLHRDHLYFTSGSVLSRVLASGGVTEKVADLPGTLDGPIAIGDEHVFFVSGGMAWRVVKAGGVPEMIGDAPGQITKTATDNTAFYFSTVNNSEIEIRRADTPGGSSTLLALGTTDGVERLVSDGTHVYWAPFQGGRIQRVAVEGGEAEMFADSSIGVAANTSVFGLALSFGEVVWSAQYQSFPDGRLFAVPMGGGFRRELSQTGTLTGVAVVGNDVFFAITGSTESAIAKVSLAGTPRTIIGCVPDRVLSVQASVQGVFASVNGELVRFSLE